MGWGCEPHEGNAARLLGDGRLTTTWTAATSDFVAYVATCSCGWQGGVHPPTDDGYDAASQDWQDKHWLALVTPDPDQMLVLGRESGGARHFLAGHPVHCGSVLELLMAGGRWIPVRYEWDFARPPRFYFTLGGPWEDVAGGPEQVIVVLPSNAVLRWPT